MAIVKKRNEQIQSRLMLESDEPVDLPAAAIEERAVIVQFDQHKPFVPELLDALRAGTRAELVPVMMDGSTFAIHSATRTFWVKLWHASPDLDRIERAQIISCLPSTRGVRVQLASLADEADDADETDDEYFDEVDDADETHAISIEQESMDERDAKSGR